MAGPLDGVRIIDLSTMLSGPWAADILGDQGADVIKVEVPGKGDHTRSLRNRQGGLSSMFLNINRSKRSVTLNLKSAEGKAILIKMVESADVLLQNFRPGVTDRLGIGWDDLREVNPRLVYVSISGFGEQGPYAHKRVYDPVVQALSGLTTIQAGSDSARPRLIRTILPDKLSAVTAAQATVAALLARERTGEGQHVRLSMLDAVLSFLWASDMGGQTFYGKEVGAQEAASFIDLIYETKDGYMTVSVMTDKEWKGLCAAVERPDWLADPRFSSPSARDQHVNERLELTQSALLERTTEEWLEILDRHDVPCAPALTRAQLIDHPQVLASDVLRVHDHPVAGKLRQPRTAARFEGTPPPTPRGAPLLGEHTEEVLRELGYDGDAISELQTDGVVGISMAAE
jgi:crotonobetainyl-CoA:carnitine CoA-transferase CaiB-like acyl-CoA transferase